MTVGRKGTPRLGAMLAAVIATTGVCFVVLFAGVIAMIGLNFLFGLPAGSLRHSAPSFFFGGVIGLYLLFSKLGDYPNADCPWRFNSKWLSLVVNMRVFASIGYMLAIIFVGRVISEICCDDDFGLLFQTTISTRGGAMIVYVAFIYAEFFAQQNAGTESLHW